MSQKQLFQSIENVNQPVGKPPRIEWQPHWLKTSPPFCWWEIAPHLLNLSRARQKKSSRFTGRMVVAELIVIGAITALTAFDIWMIKKLCSGKSYSSHRNSKHHVTSEGSYIWKLRLGWHLYWRPGYTGNKTLFVKILPWRRLFTAAITWKTRLEMLSN